MTQESPEPEAQKARKPQPAAPSARRPYVSRLQRGLLTRDPEPTTSDFFDVPTLDLEIDPAEEHGDADEFNKRRQFSFKYFGR